MAALHWLICALYGWQTMIAGTMALLGAWLTIRGLQRQSSEDAERKLRSTRAMLPATLDYVCRFVVDSIRWLKSTKEKAAMLEKGNYTNQPLSTGTCPRLDNGTIKALQDCVEHFGIDEARFISRLLSKIQVHQSKTGSLSDYFDNHMLYHSKQFGLVRSINESIVAGVEITALAFRAFPFAREESDKIDGELDMPILTSAFHQCLLNENVDTDVWNMMTTPYLGKSSSIPIEVDLGGQLDAE